MEHAMVSAATGVLSPILGKLSTLLEKEYSKLNGVRNEILSLKDELSSMNALLLKLADMEDLDVQVKEWRKQIRELSYDIEDCIDNFTHQVNCFPTPSRCSLKRFAQHTINKVRTLRARHEIANKILKLKARVDDASERRKRYNFDGIISSSSTVAPIDPRLPALYAEAESLVGIDEPSNYIIERLTEREGNSVQKLKVVSVVGLGGLGKTTLARQVYNKIGDKFDCRAFVSVSQKPDMRKIFRNILTSITGMDYYQGMEAWDEGQLINKLRDLLNGKRYLIVVDDIWSSLVWKTIRCALLDNNLSSRVLTTTRIISVARSCCYPDYNHVCEMKPLSDVDAEKLFLRRIFGSEDQCPIHLKEISNDILRKCGGLPLAIVSLASLLACKSQTKEQWEKYRNSICLALKDDPSANQMEKILSLSYNDLPHHLKTCLLYLSTFPEDFIIYKHVLVRRWIAEGFVTAEGGQSSEDVGEGYFNELINRSMIQQLRTQYDRASTCRVHDMIFDLIVSKSIEENFITLIGYKNHVQGPQGKVRRLSLKCLNRDDITMPPTTIVSSARSLTIYGSTKYMPLISDFQALRVINIEYNNALGDQYLIGVGKLFQLKYLRLIEVNISNLPEQIGELQQLETIELEWTKIKELPKGIARLKKLVFLRADFTSLPAGIGYMKALRHLSWIKTDNSTPLASLHEMGNLPELIYLDIHWRISDAYNDHKRYTECLVSSITRLCKQKLQYLRIRSDFSKGCSLDFLLDSWLTPPNFLRKFDMFSDYYFPRIPDWMALLSNITYLDINVSPATEDTLTILGKLPSLEVLWLWTKAVEPKGRFIIGSTGFQCLKEFYFGFWKINMGPIMFEVGAMAKVEKLLIELKAQGTDATSSGDFYIDVQHISSLRYLRVGIDCRDARAQEVEAIETTVRSATNFLPNHLLIEIRRHFAGQMVEDRGTGIRE
ncbi:unnamed protein product [Urochloa decumbens]|uniref:Uncharacterized protein n=1 Tax=Urochloa decumbens TaxID=240449 RepID=A0ABC9B986_9POAL